MHSWYGAVEAGGTKFVCLVGRDPDDVVAMTTLPTTTPAETFAATIAFFEANPVPAPAAIGIASFGPVELRRNQPDYGYITRTTKPGWSGANIAGAIGAALSIPVGFDTDVNGAALAEGRWGAGRDLDSFAYVTVGTGIGVGIVVAGRIVHGMIHPEVGHVPIRRVPDDPFDGVCPYHGDCLEGMASGPALAARFGRPGAELDPADQVRATGLVAGYLADGLRTVVYTVAPQRIIVGGGVSSLPDLLPQVRHRLLDALGGYPGLPEHAADDFVAAPALGSRAGALGGLVLAAAAAAGD
jgi:fructokinase